MGLLELASGQSFWRGYDYYKSSKVKTCQMVEETQYEGTVEGSEGALYKVVLDLKHPKKSTCECPHADGTRRVCKHKVALYLSLFPEEGERIIKEAEAWEEEEKARQDRKNREIEKYVNSLSKQELREELLWRLIEESNRKWY